MTQPRGTAREITPPNPDPNRSNTLRLSTWLAIRAAQRAVRAGLPEDPNRDIVIKAALDVAAMHMDEWTRAVNAMKEAIE